MNGRRGRQCIVVPSEHGNMRVQVTGKLTRADREAVEAFARALVVDASNGTPTREQLQHRERRHLRNLVLGVRGVASIARNERECALCNVPLRRGDEIVSCEGGLLCPRDGAWPCTIHADHREDPEQ